MVIEECKRRKKERKSHMQFYMRELSTESVTSVRDSSKLISSFTAFYYSTKSKHDYSRCIVVVGSAFNYFLS
jgi:hypothetical protein